MYQKIGLALAFSPTCKALLAEAARLTYLYSSELILIHVGLKTSQKENLLASLLKDAHVRNQVKVVWQDGKPAKTIIKVCKKENINLLIAGALKHESLINYYLGSIARKILRKAPCSVLILTEPSEKAIPFREIVMDVEDTPLKANVMEQGIELCKLDGARILHLVREIKLYGLAMSVIAENSATELSELRKKMVAQELKKVEKDLESFDMGGLKVNIKIIAGKSGFELRKFAKHVNADLLIVGAVEKKLVFFDRLFKHDLEYIFEDIPCNLLVIKKSPKPKE